MRICYFGDFDPDYIRTRVLLRGLRENNARIFLCNSQAGGKKRFIELFKKYRALGEEYDLMIVRTSDVSRWSLFLARLLTRKPIVWDAHYSLYDAWVFDKQFVSQGSFKAKYHWFLEWLACKVSDMVFLDTDKHVDYFVEIFKADRNKFIRVFVGADDTTFVPEESKGGDNDFIVNFWGKYIPLQGIQYIVRAAKILEEDSEIKFNILGRGQTYREIRELASNLNIKNINFIDGVPYEAIPKFIGEADVCLGLFGNTAKTQRVIANKVYETIAMAKPVISADT
ncbi:MAG: glycosyl transferase family 1, partial [Candidatus Portnoybacteria bacterium CG_4_10_14_0_2_um_filter_44_20]